jgi:hypothetical protein
MVCAVLSPLSAIRTSKTISAVRSTAFSATILLEKQIDHSPEALLRPIIDVLVPVHLRVKLERGAVEAGRHQLFDE